MNVKIDDQIIQNQLKEIRNRPDYAERNINSHIPEDASLSGKVMIGALHWAFCAARRRA